MLHKIVTATTPESLFLEPREDVVRRVFNDLVKVCHPDHAPGHEEEFIALCKLRDEALAKIRAGTWETPGLLKLTASKGRKFEARYRKKARFDLGETYIGERVILFILDEVNKDLAKRAVNVTRLAKYADEAMKREFSRYVPRVIEDCDLADGRRLLVIHKDPTIYRLRDVFDHFGGALDPKHVAWIVSRLLSLSAWFQFCGIAHYGLCVDNLYVSPKHHLIYPMGWWYAHNTREKLVAAPKIVLDNIDARVFSNRQADWRVNQNCARMVGRELLGDVSGAHLQWNTGVPEPMRRFLLHTANDDAVADFILWKEKILPECFGPPKFIKMEVDGL